MKIALPEYRRSDMTIDLRAAFIGMTKDARYGSISYAKALIYLTDIEEVHPINSRQAAAVALATAKSMLETF